MVELRCPECLTASESADPGATGWDCPCGCSYGLRRCSACGAVSPVSSLHKRGQPWTCVWCKAPNDGYTRRHDPAAVTVAELAHDPGRQGPGSTWEPPAISAQSAALPSMVAFRRSPMRWLIVVLFSATPGLIFLSGLGVSSTHGWEKFANGAALLAFVAFGIRIAKLGIFAGPEQIVVVNYFRTYRIGWAEVVGFEAPPTYGTLRHSGLRIHLTDGRLVSATLYQRGAWDVGTAAGSVVRELERLRQQHADGQVVTPPAADGPVPGQSAIL